MVRRRVVTSACAWCAVVAVVGACDGTAPVVRRAANLVTVSGDQQRAEVGTPLPAPVVMRVVDSSGAPVGGVTVDFALREEYTAEPLGTLDATAVVTDRDGLARVRWTLGTMAHAQALDVSMTPDGAAAPVKVTLFAIGRPAVATSMVARSSQDLGVTVGLSTRAGVLGYDRYGNFSPTFAGLSWQVLDAAIAPITEVIPPPTDRLPPDEFAIVLGKAAGTTMVEAHDVAAGTIRYRIRVYDAPAVSRPVVFAGAIGAAFESGIWTATGGAATPTRLASGQLDRPTWSPDGRQIAFGSVSGSTTASTIQVMNADGSGARAITAATHPGGEYQPAWSPDGSKIAFVARFPTDSAGSPYTSSAIYVINADGSAQTRIAMPSPGSCGTYPACGGAQYPAWSPDGGRIAFAFAWAPNSRTAVQPSIYVVNADGSGLQQLSIGRRAFEPTWSPDGTRIAFSSNTDSPYITDIYVVNVDGTGLTRLTNAFEALSHDATPSWSPNGLLGFVRQSELESLSEIFVMNPDGTDQRSVIQVVGHVRSWAWKPVVP